MSIDSHLETPSRPAVDFEVLEDQKENIRPISVGRSAASLTKVFSAEPKLLSSDLEKGHKKFQEEIKALEDFESGDKDYDELVNSGTIPIDSLDDPLDIYHRYVKWFLSVYPTGGSLGSVTPSATTLIPLLETATRRFSNNLRYKQDLRYLKLWTLYARQLEAEQRIDVWRFLLSNDIGTSYASLYEDLAGDLEAQGRSVNLKSLDNMSKAATGRKRLLRFILWV